MSNKTECIRIIVRNILRTLAPSYGVDIIEDVCLAIEGNPDWHRQYDECCASLNKRAINQAIGRYTKEITGLQTFRRVNATRSKLIKSYTKLGS